MPVDKRAEYEALTKQKTLVLQVATKAESPSEDQLEKIRPFLLRDFSADDLYIRRMMLANDQTDRSGERFDAGYLKRFAETITGKSVLIGHDYGTAPFGRFFDADVTTDADGWSWVAPWFYTPKSAGNQLERDYIDSGVWSYVSIGAHVDYKGLTCDICKQPYYYWLAGDESSASCPHIAGETYGDKACTLTWDSKKSDMSTVEAVEGSIVYLGCQYEAAIAKSAEIATNLTAIKREKLQSLPDITPPHEGGEPMENSMDELIQVKADLSAREAEVTKLTAERDTLEKRVKELEPLADTGKMLTERTVAEIKRLAGCVNDTLIPTVIDGITDVAKLLEIEEALSAKWAEKRGITPDAVGEHAGGSEPKAKHAEEVINMTMKLHPGITREQAIEKLEKFATA